MRKNLRHRLKKVLYLSILFMPVLLLTGCGSLGLTADNLSMGATLLTGGCWPCTMFRSVWEAIGSAFGSTIKVTSKLASILLGAGLLFWLTLTIGKMIASLKEPNMKDFIPKIVAILFKALAVGLIVNSPNFLIYILDLLISPVMEGCTNVALTIIGKESDWFKVPFSDVEKNYAIFTKNIGSQLQNVVYQMYLQFRGGFFLGARMMMHWELMAIITGGLIMCMFFYFMMFFPLVILEGFVSIGVALILFPILLVGWVFPPTKGYISESFKVFFQGISQVLVTAIYISIIVAIIEEYSDAFSITKSLSDPALLAGLTNMSNNGLAMLGLIYAMFKLTNDIPNITSYFVGEMNRSSIVSAFSKTFQIAGKVGMIAMGGALAGTGIMKGMGETMMKAGVAGMANDVRSWENKDKQEQEQASNAEQRQVLGQTR